MTIATAPVPVAPTTVRLPRPSWLASVVGIVGFVLAWQLVAAFVLDKSVGIPAPTDILHQMSKDGFSFYWRNAKVTAGAAFKGWVFGNLIAIALAMLVLVAPFIEKPLIQLGVTTYCLPVVAIGPIFAIVFDGETPKVILAAMLCFFTTLIGTLLGLRSADRTSLDMVHAYGGGPVDKLLKVRLRASLPSLFAALQIAAPSAVLGAIIGEYLGAESGLGVTMINSQQALEVPRTWALALVATALAGGTYALTGFIGRRLTPWAPKGAR